MTTRSTHTVATLEVSAAAYDEVHALLADASYQHAFMHDGTIDMTGIGIVRGVDPSAVTGRQSADATSSYERICAMLTEMPLTFVPAVTRALLERGLREVWNGPDGLRTFVERTIEQRSQAAEGGR